MKKTSELCIIIAVALCTAGTALAADRPSWPATLPVYDHIVIVVEENKDFEQILGRTSDAPYFRKLAAEGATFERMFAEEHFSEGNYFWLFSSSNQNVGFLDQVPSKANHPDYPFKASNLGEQLIKKGLSFKGYSESLPNIGSTVDFDPPNCRAAQCVYARKHVPWISFANIPNGTTVETSSNLRFADFPRDYTMLPTVAFVIPNLNNDMHNGKPAQSIPAGDTWLRQNLDDYYQWAKRYRAHQSAHRTRPAILAQVQPPATRSSEPSRHHFCGGAYKARIICRRKRDHARERPAHNRSDVRAPKFRCAAA